MERALTGQASTHWAQKVQRATWILIFFVSARNSMTLAGQTRMQSWQPMHFSRS